MQKPSLLAQAVIQANLVLRQEDCLRWGEFKVSLSKSLRQGSVRRGLGVWPRCGPSAFLVKALGLKEAGISTVSTALHCEGMAIFHSVVFCVRVAVTTVCAFYFTSALKVVFIFALQ